MSRTFGKLLCTIWADPDFLALSPNAKVLYAAFVSQDDISAAGVLPLTERRWRRWIDGTPSSVSGALDELLRGRFVVVDDDTAEVWVRSFIRHDGRLENSKLRATVTAAVANVRSLTIAAAVDNQYPDVFPRRRELDSPSRDDRTPIDIDSDGRPDVTDLNLDLEPEPPQNPDDLTANDIAQAGGEVFANTEAQEGRARDQKGLARWKTDELLKQPEPLQRIALWNERHKAWTGWNIPRDVLGAAALGDKHSLGQFPEYEPVGPPPEPERVDRNRRLELLTSNGAPERLVTSPIATVELPAESA